MAALAMRRLARVAERLRAGIRTPPATCPRDAPRARLFASSPPEASASARVLARNGPGLADFLRADPSGGGRCGAAGSSAVLADDATATSASGARRTAYVETYGCQMNVNDSEVMMAVLAEAGYDETTTVNAADVILINTCAIRDKAEAKIWQRLAYFRSLGNGKKKAEKPVVGVLGCMAERLKTKLLEADQLADLVAGPDAYRDLPNLISAVNGGEKAMNVQLSVEETYADIVPVRKEGAHAAFVTIMRGCDNACSFCIVPYTRGRERSRDPASIEYEVRLLSEQGVKEVTLLGQNVNSYAYSDEIAGGGTTDFLSMLSAGIDDGKTREEDVLGTEEPRATLPGMSPEVAAAGGTPFVGYAEGFSSRYRADKRREGSVQFAALLDRVAAIDPEMRVRFTSPHPKDFPDEVLDVIARRPNVCNCLHMPAQSGNTRTLENMARGYTREAYLNLIDRVKAKIPGCAITTDIIVGFCGETEEEHEDTVSLIRQVKYESAFMFAYSMREKTGAARRLTDDVPEATKKRRLAEIIAAQREEALLANEAEIGKIVCVLVDGAARKDKTEKLAGRTCANKRVVVRRATASERFDRDKETGFGVANVPLRIGEYVAARVTGANASTLFAEPVARTTLSEFYRER